MQLRLIEESKIHCAREHFKTITNGEMVYDVVNSYQSLLEIRIQKRFVYYKYLMLRIVVLTSWISMRRSRSSKSW